MCFDVHAATIAKLQSYLEERLVALDVALEVLDESVAEVKEEKEVNENFPTCNE